jgi:hypothetical protein
MKISSSHQNLLELFQSKEANGEIVSEDEIIRVSGWTKVTLRTYLNKGQFSDFLNKSSTGNFEVFNCLGLSVKDFTKCLSQSKNIKNLDSVYKSKLAKELVKSSKDNMLLGLELYNRPSLENRIDIFVQCFCTAWEKLLKAILIEKHGENHIFRNSKNSNKIRETISLRDCMDQLYCPHDSVRKNIEKIAYYRDRGIHLLMPEVQSIMSRFFQSGIVNYSKEFKIFTKEDFISSNHAGLISLVGDLKTPCIKMLQNKYGKETGEEISWLISDLKKQAEIENNTQFAIPIDVDLVFATKDNRGNIITLAKGEDAEGLEKAIVIKKPSRREETHPYKESDAIREINQRLYERYTVDQLIQLITINKHTNKPEINTNCFRAVIAKSKWKSSDNRYHHANKDPEYHYFSDFAVEEFIKKVMENQGYLKKAKQDYSVMNMNKNKHSSNTKKSWKSS